MGYSEDRLLMIAFCDWVELQDDEATMSASRLLAWKEKDF